MKTSIRAYRILEDIQNYHKAAESSPPFSGSTSDLGEPIGYYKNPEPDGEVVEIYTEGLHWSAGSKVFDVSFKEIEKAQLADAKESMNIIIHTKNGMLISMPVKGQRGNFFDSMEMLRFLDRVIKDAQ